MPWKLSWFCVVLTAVCAAAAAERPGGDPLHSLLFGPEFLIRHRAEIGLTDRQLQHIRARLEDAGPKAREHQMQRNKAMGRLARLLAAEKVDEDAALKQLDELLAIEKQARQLHFRLMIQIRNTLTAKQRAALAKIRRDSNSAVPPRKKTAMSELTPDLTPAAVRAAVDALKKEDVAWRKIAWKTCLLEGLKASREQNKPIILWIFIDRPIDDERC